MSVPERMAKKRSLLELPIKRFPQRWEQRRTSHYEVSWMQVEVHNLRNSYENKICKFGDDLLDE